MPTPSLGTILEAVQVEAKDAGMRFTPTYPPDSAQTGLFSAVWIEAMNWDKLGTEVLATACMITAQLMKPHVDTARDMEALAPLLVSFPEQMHANPTLGQNQDIFRSMAARRIATEDAAGTPMIGYQFDITFDLSYH